MSVKNRQSLRDALKKKLSAYVLITCSEPSIDGQMNVEMTYQGDKALVSYLLQGAVMSMLEEEPCQKPVLIDTIHKS